MCFSNCDRINTFMFLLVPGRPTFQYQQYSYASHHTSHFIDASLESFVFMYCPYSASGNACRIIWNNQLFLRIQGIPSVHIVFPRRPVPYLSATSSDTFRRTFRLCLRKIDEIISLRYPPPRMPRRRFCQRCYRYLTCSSSSEFSRPLVFRVVVQLSFSSPNIPLGD